jgi:hypothetical protein
MIKKSGRVSRSVSAAAYEFSGVDPRRTRIQLSWLRYFQISVHLQCFLNGRVKKHAEYVTRGAGSGVLFVNLPQCVD